MVARLGRLDCAETSAIYYPVLMPSPNTDGPNPAPDRPTEDAGDLSLIRWMLSLTVSERLDVLQDQADTIAEMRSAIEKR